LNGVSAFQLTLRPSDVVALGTSGAPCVGAFHQTKPVFKGGVDVTPLEFQAVLTILAARGELQLVCDFEPPFRGGSRIVAVKFSGQVAHSNPELQERLRERDKLERIAVNAAAAAQMMGCGKSTFFARVRKGLYPMPGRDGLWSVQELRECSGRAPRR
jgi:hypothetical protein